MDLEHLTQMDYSFGDDIQESHALVALSDQNRQDQTELSDQNRFKCAFCNKRFACQSQGCYGDIFLSEKFFTKLLQNNNANNTRYH